MLLITISCGETYHAFDSFTLSLDITKAQAQIRNFSNLALRAQAARLLHDHVIVATGLLHLAQITCIAFGFTA